VTPAKWVLIGVHAVALALAACTMEPRYRRPDAPVAHEWPTGPAYASATDGPRAATPAADIGWRDFFTDHRLQKLIELALEHNSDARIAVYNVAAAQAQYRIQRADLFPTIAASGVEQVEKFPAAVAGIAETGGLGSATGNGATPVVAGSNSPNVFRYFDVGVGFTSYEIDVFGKLRSLNHQRLQQYFSYVETRKSTQISLVAEVADAYLTLLADRKLLQITADTLTSQEDSLNLIKMSFDGGVATALDLQQAQTTVATAQANIAQYTRQAAQDENALVLLIGAPLPADLPPEAGFDEQALLADLPAGLPSDLLERRPDIRAAERNLLAANASIGAARAAFFPSITLTGNYGTASTQLSGLFDHGSTAWTFSPQISLPLFAGGANVASLDLAKQQKNISVVQYEHAIQVAFREVADALAGRGTLDRERDADQSLVNSAAESYRLSDMRFQNGVDSFLNVLVSQRSLYSAQQALVAVQLARLENLVSMYKVLGGGWYERSVAAAAPMAAVFVP
jgi:outer membrane protein, multidrug efflux system